MIVPDWSGTIPVVNGDVDSADRVLPDLPTSLTLVGAGFGAIANPKPTAYDTFNDYGLEAHGDEIPRNESNPYWVDTVNTTYPTSNKPYYFDSAVTFGDRSYSIKSHGQEYRSRLAVPIARQEGQPVDHNKLYATWWIRFNESLGTPPQNGAGSAKLCRIWDDAGGDNSKMRASWLAKAQGYMANTYANYYDESPWDNPNIWHRLEVYVDQDIGHMIWIDGKFEGTLSVATGEVCHKSGTTPDPFFVRLIGHDIRWTQADTEWDVTPTLHHWLADYYQGNSRARVELSNNPAFNDSIYQMRVVQHCETRTDSEISIPEPFYGELDQSQPIYAHIIKDDGSVIDYGSVA